MIQDLVWVLPIDIEIVVKILVGLVVIIMGVVLVGVYFREWIISRKLRGLK